MGFYYYNYSYFLWMLPAILLTAYAQFKVQAAFNRYSKVRSLRGCTGAQAAETVAYYGGVRGLNVRRIGGNLTDNFDPRNNTISLSQDVYDSTSISAIGVAAHEAGHSIQTAQGYLPNRLRTAIVPATQFASRLAFPLIFIGLILPVRYTAVVNIGILMFSIAVLFQLVTLPVEFNASARALRSLDETNLLTPDEINGARKVLSAAAMTYVAASFTALLQLFRLLMIAGGRGRDDS
ncbi:MAG: zinc metallopeptidase [Oscillospiraceae bacterium]|jgi:Zn-dependent membrane protease YugP|nr:zinc metallopeptidase [Oscillospiraceae bacterium]MDD3261460.1 zinc metallopeptidase [Oscillospiraceae bacterium]